MNRSEDKNLILAKGPNGLQLPPCEGILRDCQAIIGWVVAIACYIASHINDQPHHIYLNGVS